ncbi:Bud site selection protein bud4 [Coemansia sp. RSA 2704]|nr:Bud site selection protein bud4 [Coemansia sp. RSA 2704]
MHFRHQQPRRTRQPSKNSDSDFDLSDGEELPESVIGPIEIPKSPSHPSSSRIGSTPGMRAPTHIDFSSSPHSPRSLYASGSAPVHQQGRFGQQQQHGGSKWPQQLYKQWFGAIAEGRSIQVHSILADHPDVLNMRRREPTPFHMALTHIASEWLGNDTTGMDGLQVAIMGYKNAYANWRLGNGPQTEHMAGMSADQMKEHVAVREVILGALIDAISPEQLDSHFFGRQQNTTLHLAAFYNDANLVERLLRQGAAVDISNRMGFLPTGITNDKPTLQWLAMYRGQVRGSRYSPSQLQPQNYTPESDSALDQFGDVDGSPISVPRDARTQLAETELELESLEHFSDDDEVSESSYIKQFADSARSMHSGAGNDDVEHDSASDEFEQSEGDLADNVSVVSSNDRCSLGLGGSKPNLANRSLEGPNLRKRALESNKRADATDSRPVSRGSNFSYTSDTAHTSPTSMSNTPSVLSYHTANGTFSDGPSSPMTPGDAPDANPAMSPDTSIRIKVDPNSIRDNEIDDIFSDEDDDGVVQMEPSFCNSGAGLSDSEHKRSVERPSNMQSSLVSSKSSSASINMQSLGKAMAQAAVADKPMAKSTAISAFPVMIPDTPQRAIDDSGKLMRPVDQLKQESTGKGAQPRAASPFMLRDSLYEMIMGRSNSRLSMASINSTNSNALSNTSTVSVSKEQQPQNAQPRSPTSPTSQTSYVSPTSTTFDESNGSPSQTAISSPTDNVSFNAVAKSSSVQVPEAVPEEDSHGERKVELLPPRPTFSTNDYDDSDSSSSSDDSDDGSNQNMGFDSRNTDPESPPRPTAASLFAAPLDDSQTPAGEPASSDEAEAEYTAPLAPVTADAAFRGGRIGRRLGRETVEMMLDDDDTGPAAEAKFDFMAAKSADAGEALGSASDDAADQVGQLPSNVPLTREKRDQYLQTLINRNTMRGASPSKRATHSAMMLAMRSASPVPAPAANDAAMSAGEDDSDGRSPSRGATLRQRHVSKRSEGAIDFVHSRSPSALGMRERNWDPESLPRPSSSQYMREALSVSGASINGRMRANTLSNVNAPAKHASPTARKVSPSLANLKTRNLVSNSPAKVTEPVGDHSPLGMSPTRQLKLMDSRTRAMSTPVDAQPPALKLPGVGSDVASVSRPSATSARIGRVAALSQNFERQQSQGPPRIAIPSRAAALADKQSIDKTALSAPLGNPKSMPKRPATRSSSMSSSHSAGGHGQPTNASSARDQNSRNTGKDDPSQSGQNNDQPPADDNNGDSGNANQGSGGGAGGHGHGDDGDDSSGSGKPSPNPRAALLEPLESNDSSSSHNSSSSTGRGLAASIRGDSPSMLLGSSGSGDNVGSSIFSSTESKSSTGAEPLSVSEPSRLHAPVSSRRETEAERKRRFRELANRRKSGTLEKISGSGLVKNRQALFVPSDPTMRASPKPSSSSSKRSRVQFAEVPDKPPSSGTSAKPTEDTGSSFLGQRGEGSRPPDSAGNDGMPSSLSSVDVDLERLRRVNTPSLHPSAPQLTRESSVRGGVGVDAVLERTLAQAHSEATRAAQGAVNAWSRGSGSDKSKAGSASGDDSLHILSSLDTNSTPGSTPLDSAPDNTKVGLLAQYDLDQRRIDRRLKRMSRASEHSYIQPGNVSQTSSARSDIELGFSTIGDMEPRSDDDADEQPATTAADDGPVPVSEEQLGERFDTMMPSRPRYTTQALFGLSTVAEEDEESRNPSIVVSDAQKSSSAAADVTEIHEYRSPTQSLRGLRAALGPHMAVAPIYRGLGSVSIPDATAEDPVSPLGAGVTQEALDAAMTGDGQTSPRPDMDDDTQSRTPSMGSHSFDPYLVFGYTSEDNSTMASRSSLERSDIFNMGRPGSSASRVMYMHPLDAPDTDSYLGDSDARAPVASSSRIPGRWLQDPSSPTTADRPGSSGGSSGTASYVGKGKSPARRLPEMQQIQPTDSLPHAPAQTVEEIDADASSDEEPIPKLLFIESQDFEGYVPIGRQIQQDREERRQERRRQKEAAKLGITLPEEEPEEVISPLWFEENNIVDPLPPNVLKTMVAKRDQLMVKKISKHRTTEHPDLKRELESSTISSRRLREELDATMDEDSIGRAAVSHGTIKQLVKRPRTSDISNMFEPPTSDDDQADAPPPNVRRSKRDQRRSFLDSVEIPMSELSSSSSSEDGDHERQVPMDERMMPLISQEFQVPGDSRYKSPEFDMSLVTGTPRKRLVLRSQPKTFSERVLTEVNEMNVSVKTDVLGSVHVHSAGQFAYEPSMGTVRPSTIPQYVSQLNGVPAGPFFMPPKASVKSGYLYMRILSIDDMEEPPNSVYFVIRNGIDTLATTPVSVSGASNTTINQEFRILTDPSVSITMWMRFRSDAIIYRNGRNQLPYGQPGCMPPLLRKLVRRNTRSRNRRWQCASPEDSVFDFASDQPRFEAGARRAGPMGHAAGFAGRRPHQQPASGYPERVSSALMSHNARRYPSDRGMDTQQSHPGYSDPRSLNATQAPSSVFYEPGGGMGELSSSHKGLAEARFKEETRGVAVVHVGEMIEEVFLRGLVDSWDVENVWENRKGARMSLQLFFIPECPLFREEELPKTLSECEMAMEVCGFHNRTLNSGYMSQRGGDTRFWRRRYFRLIGGFLFAYHEDTKEPRCFIDLNDATRVVDLQAERAQRANASRQSQLDLVRTQRTRRRPTHKRNNSDYSSRDGANGAAERGALTSAPGHNYASDSEPADLVDIADPELQRSSMRRQQQRGRASVSFDPQAQAQTDSGVFSQASSDMPDNGMQHSFSIEFGSGGLIEFYTESEREKRVWVEIIKRVVGNIPKIPSWLIKLLHADVSERIEGGMSLASDSSLGNVSVPSSKFQEMSHPHPHLQL